MGQCCIQWSSNQTVELISKNLNIKILMEKTEIVNGKRFMGPN